MKVQDMYWHLAAERQEILFKRLKGLPPPWTDDPILQKYKFTNAYRVADRVSQYLIKEVIYRPGLSKLPQDIFLRIILFKVFNKTETWELLREEFGEITVGSFSVPRIRKFLDKEIQRGIIFSNAYMLPGQATKAVGKTTSKHDVYLRVIDRMLDYRAWETIQKAERFDQVYDELYSYPMLGSFLAYQFATDLNYSTLCNFDEDSLCVPGPGAIDGIRKMMPDVPYEEMNAVIRTMVDEQEKQFKKRRIRFKTLYGRRLHMIDCQNLFCELSKYTRVAAPEVLGELGRTRIKATYNANGLREVPPLVFPPKWCINTGGLV